MMSSGDPGLHILLSMQLLLSLLAMWAWWRVSRDDNASLKRASQVSAAWFAFFAVLIAYLYDVGMLR